MYKRLLFIAFLIGTGITFYSCTTIIDSVVEEEPVDERDNPNDPNSPNATLPDLILSGGLNFGQTFTVNSENITITWETSGSGITNGLRYRYKLAAPGEDLATTAFSDYQTETSVSITVFETLNSDTYNFEIEISSDVNTSLTPKSFTGSFQVDAYQDQTFLFVPNRIGNNGDGTFTAKLFVDEIDVADEITAYRLDIVYDNLSLSTNESAITIYDDTRNFLYRSNAQLITFTEIVGDTIRIESGAAGTGFSAFSGAGALGEIDFIINGGFSSGTLRVSPTSVFKTINGEDVQVSSFVSAEINQSF